MPAELPEPGIDPLDALGRVAREEGGRVLALLARRFSDLDLADDAVQDALTEAARVWPDLGVPANPPAWLLAVARRKAIDRLRRASSATRRTMAAAPDLLAHDDAPSHLPTDLDSRVDAVLAVLYLVFNEGYLSHGGSSEVVRVDLVEEAVRLTEALATLVPDRPEVLGLLALEHFHAARLATRTDAEGDLVLLEHQDRTRWDLERIRAANHVLYRALRCAQPGPYQLQAVIASHHANARTAGDTDWSAISAAYRHLVEMTGSPVVRINHAVAVAMADGPGAGLALLDAIEEAAHYHLFHAARAELLVRTGRVAEAADEFVVARRLTDNPAEQRHLDRRLRACSPGAG